MNNQNQVKRTQWDAEAIGAFIENRDALPPDDATSKQLLKEQLNKALSTLTLREQRVLQLRFGLEDGRSHTLEEVGNEFGVTRERIRQIVAKALHKVRHPSPSPSPSLSPSRKLQWDSQRIHALRRHLGLTQRKLADKLGTRQQTISEWEKGMYEPRGASATLLSIIAERAKFEYQAISQKTGRP